MTLYLDYADSLVATEWEERCAASLSRSMLRRIRDDERNHRAKMPDWVFALITALSFAVALLVWSGAVS